MPRLGGTAREGSEAAWQHDVEIMATELGWKWVHAPRSRAGRRFLTAMRGSLAEGWPDLVLTKAGRTIGAELKRHGADPTDAQLRTLAWLSSAGWETYVWWPSDVSVVREILTR